MTYDDADRCTDCGHFPGCGCTHHCETEGDIKPEFVVLRRPADPFACIPNAGDEENVRL